MQPERKRKNTALTVVLVAVFGSCFVVLLILAAILFPVFAQAREKARQTQCLSNLGMIAKSMQLYLTDYDNRFPPAAQWGDAMQAYAPQLPREAFRCPSVPPDKFGYAMNSALSRKDATTLEDPATTPLLYDSTNLSWNAHDAFTSLPNPPRHGGQVNNVAYADGHAKSLRQ